MLTSAVWHQDVYSYSDAKSDRTSFGEETAHSSHVSIVCRLRECLDDDSLRGTSIPISHKREKMVLLVGAETKELTPEGGKTFPIKAANRVKLSLLQVRTSCRAVQIRAVS